MQVELTAEQRKAYYKEALNTFRTDKKGPFICNLLAHYLHRDFPNKWPEIKENIYPNGTRYNMVAEKYFPEFYMVFSSVAEQSGNGEYYPFTDDFRGNMTREILLTEAMEILTHKKVFI